MEFDKPFQLKRLRETLDVLYIQDISPSADSIRRYAELYPAYFHLVLRDIGRYLELLQHVELTNDASLLRTEEGRSLYRRDVYISPEF